jgi:hypothetical protein
MSEPARIADDVRELADGLIEVCDRDEGYDEAMDVLWDTMVVGLGVERTDELWRAAIEDVRRRIDGPGAGGSMEP